MSRLSEERLMKKKPARRLKLKRETLQPLAAGRAALEVGLPNSAEDCTSPRCAETTCGCETRAVAF